MAYERLTKRNGLDYLYISGCYSEAGCQKCNIGCTIQDKSVKRLSELEDMIESGQAVILPCNCKIGDLVYGVSDYLSEPKLGILTYLEITKYCIQYGIVDKELMRHDVEYVYSTAEKEAAEAKLKELRGEE